MKQVRRRRRKINLQRATVAVMGLAVATITLCMAFAGEEAETEAAAGIEPTTASTTEIARARSAELSNLVYTETVLAADTTPPNLLEVTDTEIEMLAKLIWGEARGVESTTEKAAVVWCVLNRVDADTYPNTIAEVINQNKQFGGYDEDNEITDEHLGIAYDVICRWLTEKNGEGEDVGRVLPSEYIYFTGDGDRNYFTVEWKSEDYWEWELPSPYTD
ncbi:MAG: cell wall hydrolase [Firmicutes bacterium]|nr:cell wall hydrolase [Bacillota bacterium]